jgi:hypothetical protein
MWVGSPQHPNKFQQVLPAIKNQDSDGAAKLVPVFLFFISTSFLFHPHSLPIEFS